MSEDKEPELLPCPFCGGNVRVLGGNGNYFVKCGCGIYGNYHGTKKQAIRSWNIRFTPTLSNKESSISQKDIVEEYVDDFKDLLFDLSKHSYQKGYNDGNAFGKEFMKNILKPE